MAATSLRCHMSLIKKHLQDESAVEDDALYARYDVARNFLGYRV